MPSRSKEWLVKGAATQELALAKLFEDMFMYLKPYDRPQWKWRQPPETDKKFNPETWWAYARIELLKNVSRETK